MKGRRNAASLQSSIRLHESRQRLQITFSRALLMLSTTAALFCSGCWSGARSANAWDCEPSVGEVPLDANAGALAGAYRVLFVGTSGEARGKQLRGTMLLVPHEPSRQQTGAFGRINPKLWTPLHGQLDAQLARLPAIAAGRPDSRDPARPGVEIRQFDGATDGRPFRSISLHVGDEGNRRDIVMFDGASFSMELERLSPTAFGGTWSSSVGMTTYEASGHFCAWRVARAPR